MKTYTKGFLFIAIITTQIFASIAFIVDAQTVSGNTYTVSTTLKEPNPVVAEPLTVNIALSTTGAGIQNAIVQAQIFNSSNKRVHSQNITGQTITNTQPATVNVTWTPTTTGDYYVKVGVFSSDWSSNPFWSSKALSFKVITAPIVVTPVPATSDLTQTSITSNTYTVSTTLKEPNPVVAEPLTVNIALSTTGAGIQNAIVQAQIFNSSNKRVHSQNITGQTITNTQPATVNVTWTPTTTGDYYVKVGVFSSDWSSNPFWSSKALSFKVITAPIVVTPVPIVSEPTPAQTIPVMTTYGLSQNVQVQESGSMTTSANNSWWLNSGAYFLVDNGIGKTNQGNLPVTDYWSKLYANSNPLDTDKGSHPQNIFRLLTKSKFQNVSQEAYFKINRNNLSESSNRNASNGLLFFSRYVDSKNLYYTGIRVDGSAIIKKKINGVYYTMSQKKIFAGTYNANSNPNLLPLNSYIGIKSVVTDLPDGTVSIKLYVDKNNSGVWTLVAEALDNGKSYGQIIKSSAYAGIRTDFMDVEFKEYKVGNI